MKKWGEEQVIRENSSAFVKQAGIRCDKQIDK
jgi:hypothetical protein